jgi:hypothetical protein
VAGGSGAGSDYFCTKIRVKPREDSYLSFNWGVISVRRRHFTVIKPQRYTDRGLARTDSDLALFHVFVQYLKVFLRSTVAPQQHPLYPNNDISKSCIAHFSIYVCL